MFKGYIMYDTRCKGVNKEKSEVIDTKKIVEMSLKYVFNILNSEKSEVKTFFHKLGKKVLKSANSPSI
jgi:hypothetical protein